MVSSLPPHIAIDGTPVSAVEHFTYLGCVMSNDATKHKDLDNRLSNVSSSIGSLKKRVWKRYFLCIPCIYICFHPRKLNTVQKAIEASRTLPPALLAIHSEHKVVGLCPTKTFLGRPNSPVLSPSRSNCSSVGQGISREWRTLAC